MPGSRKRQHRAGRSGRPLNIWVAAEQKERLKQLARRTRVNQSEIVRTALHLLFEQVDGGQLTLGFAEIALSPAKNTGERS
jgi:predicted DNA-binding protein